MMNPLSVDVRNFLCADEGGILVGFGQVTRLRAVGENIIAHPFSTSQCHLSASKIGTLIWFILGLDFTVQSDPRDHGMDVKCKHSADNELDQ